MKTPTLVAIVTLISGTAFVRAQDLGTATSSTPYDKYFGPMRTTLSALGSNHPPLDNVRDYVRTGRGFRYAMKDPLVPQTPAETEATHSGDCKAKSLWVASKMDDHTVHFIVGKARAQSGMNHAWLLWKGPDGWLILDATMYSTPLDLARIGPNEFIPLYSFTSGGGKYVHGGGAARKKAEPKYGDHV
jgi:hypothetical protein